MTEQTNVQSQHRRARKPKQPPALPEAAHPQDGPAPRQTKIGGVLGLLQREQGATLDEMIAATGWLPHTARAALTGL